MTIKQFEEIAIKLEEVLEGIFQEYKEGFLDYEDFLEQSLEVTEKLVQEYDKIYRELKNERENKNEK